MGPVVIVHGGWGGGWEWRSVAAGLRARGHEVYTPTLTGLGERAHLGHASISLADHIDDVLAVLRYEDLRDITLCGHSYGGMVVTGVADREADRIRRLVYLDGFVPRDGQALTDLVPPEVADGILTEAAASQDGTVPIAPDLLPAEGVLPVVERDAYIARLAAHPAGTFTQPIVLTGAIERLPRAYVRCTGYSDSLMGPFVERARSEGWTIRELETEHDLQLFDPVGTTDIVDELATS